MESINIMLVEDEEITAEITRRNLERWGYVVSAVVPSGEKAIKHAEAVTPDLVLMDIGLQGDIDGIQAAQRIRECFHIPVIYLTASDDAETLARAKLTGPFGYIIKPIEETQLRATIDLALYKHEVEKKTAVSKRCFGRSERGVTRRNSCRGRKWKMGLVQPTVY